MLWNAKVTAMQDTQITISGVVDVQQLISGTQEISMHKHQPKRIAGKGR